MHGWLMNSSSSSMRHILLEAMGIAVTWCIPGMGQESTTGGICAYCFYALKGCGTANPKRLNLTLVESVITSRKM